MTGIIVLLGGIVMIVGVITVMDLLADRQKRRERLKPNAR